MAWAASEREGMLPLHQAYATQKGQELRAAALRPYPNPYEGATIPS